MKRGLLHEGRRRTGREKQRIGREEEEALKLIELRSKNPRTEVNTTNGRRDNVVSSL